MKFKFLFLFFLYFVNFSLCAENEPSASGSDVKNNNESISTEDDGPPIDHIAFLQIDDSADIQIQNSKESKLKMRKLIRQVDEDKDGKISEKELGDWIENVIKKYIVSEGKKYMPKIDSNEDGHATWDEFTVAAGYTKGDQPEPRKSSTGSKRRDKEKFDLSDMDNDGKLTYSELGVMIHPNESPHMNNIVTSEFLHLMDKDNDGRVSPREFSGGDSSAEMDESFKEVDKDNNGLLDRKEITDWMSPPEKNPFVHEAETLRADMDKNRDGFLTEKEIFKHYAKFATSRATVYGRLIRTDSDDDEPKKVAKEDMGENKTGRKKVDDEL